MNKTHQYAGKVVCTSYFTSKRDPQRQIHVRNDNFEYMKSWYESMNAVGLKGVVFHDSLTQEFVAGLTNENISFVKHALTTKRSINDERFLCYQTFLRAHGKIERVFLTDIQDVEFFRDPFALFHEERFDLYCGDDNGALIGEAPGGHAKGWLALHMEKAYGRVYYPDRVKLIAGTIGGTRRTILELLTLMAAEFEALTRNGNFHNLNMAVFNKCAYDLFDTRRIMRGPPLNSAFKGYEETGRFHIRHK